MRILAISDLHGDLASAREALDRFEDVVQPIEILLIEDNADDRALTIRAFKKSNVPNPVAVASLMNCFSRSSVARRKVRPFSRSSTAFSASILVRPYSEMGRSGESSVQNAFFSPIP